LINHLLDAARLSDGVEEREVENVDLQRLLQDCVAEVTLQYRLSNDVVQLATEAVIVRARQIDLTVIFRNLIDNAVKYAGTDPKVWVTARRKAGTCVVRIADNGKGIPVALRRKIFGRFVRVGEELERETPGTGLGLYIVRTLVRRLRGKVRVSDHEDGPGTVFEVILPAHESLAPSTQADRSPTALAASSRSELA
jgi:signal transduction histidine kinase